MPSNSSFCAPLAIALVGEDQGEVGKLTRLAKMIRLVGRLVGATFGQPLANLWATFGPIRRGDSPTKIEEVLISESNNWDFPAKVS